jgi:FG-GAP-like repeat
VSSVSVFINKGDGFERKIDYQTRRHPVSVAIGDLDRDGKRDLVAANISGRVSVFINAGDGSFRSRVDYRAGSGARSVAVGDLNGDRSPDVVTANTNLTSSGDRVDSVSVLLNRGDGRFRKKLDTAREAI